MRLRNKETGEIKEWDFVNLESLYSNWEFKDGESFDSIRELTDKWEDYPETAVWIIEPDGSLYWFDSSTMPESEQARYKDMNNWFKTEEEARIVRDKLKNPENLKRLEF